MFLSRVRAGAKWMAIVAVALTAPSAASAVTYEPPPPASPYFCGGGPARDRLTPFKPKPKLPSPPPSGRLGFGPASLSLQSLPSLVVDKGSVGYSLALRPSAAPVQLNWEVSTTLTLVDWLGRPLGKLRETRRRVTTVRPTRDVGVRFSVNGEAAFYRVIATFWNEADRKLGWYGFYFRVVPDTRGARLILSKNAFRSGQTVKGRIDNVGDEIVSYGTPFAIERLEGSSWTLAPESPDGPWTLPLFHTLPGHAGRRCSNFRIPASMAPGRYRMSKTAQVGRGSLAETAENLVAEFSVRP
ncbi:MAG TPA: immunoglobulin-like domain-containing protein [Solirubrobacterales bacterium]|nr:immunoglobulin-like domain-containing protein [Solirubrobacterales bacterium]